MIWFSFLGEFLFHYFVGAFMSVWSNVNVDNKINGAS